jgi:RNA polymerase sigma factor (sigma-70 family)
MSYLTNTMRRTLFRLGNPAALTDGQLLSRFVASQDQAAFEELVRRHGPMVLRVCRRVLQHSQDAEDAFQATFIVLMRKAAAIAKHDSVASWLHGVAVRVALKAMTSASYRRGRQSLGAAALLDDSCRPSAPPRSGPDLHPALDEELNRLPEKYRAPIVLCYLEGKSNQEAARQLQCQTNALKKRLSRAREMLRHRLARRGLGFSAGVWAAVVATKGASAGLTARLANATVRIAILAGRTTTRVAVPAVALADASLKDLGRRYPLWGIAAALLVTAALALCMLPRSSSPQVLVPARLSVPSERATLQPFLGGCNSVALSPDGRTLAAGGSSLVYLWNVGDGRHVASLGSHRSLVSSLAFTANGKVLASGSWDQTVILWDLETKKERATLKHASPVTSLAISPDGQTLAAGTRDRRVVLWDLRTNLVKATLLPGKGSQTETFVAYTPDGSTLAAGADEITLWDARTLTKRQTIPSGPVRALACAADGKTLAWTEQGGGLILWDLVAAKQRRAIRDVKDASTALAFAPDSRKVVLGSVKIQGANLSCADVTTGKLDFSIPGHLAGTSAVVFSADSRTMVSASRGGTVKLWDVPSSLLGSDRK